MVSTYLLPELVDVCYEYLAAIDIYLLMDETTRNTVLKARSKIPPPLSYDQMSFTQADGIAARGLLSCQALPLASVHYYELPSDLRPIVIVNELNPNQVSNYINYEFTPTGYTDVIPHVIKLGSYFGVSAIVKLAIAHKHPELIKLVSDTVGFSISIIITAIESLIARDDFLVLISRLNRDHLEIVLGEAMMYECAWYYVDLFIHRVNINAHDGGRTALYRAICHGCYKNTMYLLEHGADPNIGPLDKDGPLFISVQQFDNSCINELLKYPFNLRQVNSEGLNALDIARIYERPRWGTALWRRGVK